MATAELRDCQALMIEILRTLPLKSLARFQCVSKTWQHMICDACFPEVMDSQVHLLVRPNYRTTRMSHHVYVGNRKVLYACGEFLGVPIVPGIHLLDSCNGLLLLLVGESSWWPRRESRAFIVCNPLTKQFKYLLFPPQLGIGHDGRDVALAFDSSISSQFKIVIFDQGKRQLIVFSSVKDWCWQVFPFKLQGSLVSAHWNEESPSVYHNGAIFRLFVNSRQILKFVINGKKASTALVRGISLPLEAPIAGEECIGVGNSSLCYANCDGIKLQTWTLKEDTWVPKHKVSVEEICNSNGLKSVQPCAFHPSSDDIFLGCNGGKCPNIYCYNFNNQKLRPQANLFSLKEHEDFARDYYCFFPFRFSLLSMPTLKAKHGVDVQVKHIFSMF